MAEKLILTVTKLRKPTRDALVAEALKQERTISQQVRLHLENIYAPTLTKGKK